MRLQQSIPSLPPPPLLPLPLLLLLAACWLLLLLLLLRLCWLGCTLAPSLLSIREFIRSTGLTPGWPLLTQLLAAAVRDE